ncbi:MAG: aminotransferase class IV [Planctomycetota bacterium]
MSEPYVFLNSKLLPLSEAHISPFDPGFLLGDGLFETLRIKNGRVLFLNSHLNRLRKGTKFLNIPCPLTRQKTDRIINSLISKNKIAEGRLRITLTSGTNQNIPTILFTLNKFKEPSKNRYNQGFKIIISKYHVLAGDIFANIKTTDRVKHSLARKEATSLGADEALFLNEKNQIAECTTTNIFLVNSGKLFTPHKNSGILEGTVRNLIMKLAKKNGIQVKELSMQAESLFTADEIFLTNSLGGVLPVSYVNKVRIGKKTPGAITNRVSELYKKAVTHELI